jgi:hypothetical protein
MMESRRLAICVVVVLWVCFASSNAFAQSAPSLFVDQYSRGDEVIIQGCVKVIPDKQSVFLTQITTWPILRLSSTSGPYHFWTTDYVRELSEYLGDTVQMTGRIIDLERSEIETEPGLHRFGKSIAIELPNRDVVVRAEAVGFDPTGVKRGADIPLTLAQVKVERMLRVLRGCLPAPRAATSARRQ